MKKYILILTAFLTAGVTSCKKDYLSLEVNPNNPSVSTPALSLAGAEVTAAAIINEGDYSEYPNWTGVWTPSGNYVPSSPLQQYQFTSTDFTGVWTDLYSNLTNFNTLQVSSSKDPAQANFQAIAMIMKAYDFEQLVDNFNDVPYSQAFQPSTILFPAYDKGLDIYHDLGKQLDAAIALINKSTTAANPGGADIIFKGDMTGWKKFANSLKLRLAIRVSSTIPGDPLVTDLASTASEGYLDGSIDAEANPGYTNTLSNGNSQQSPFWAFYGFDTNGNPTFPNAFARANAFAVNLLKNYNDTRLPQLYAPTTGAPIQIRGNSFGDVVNTLSNPYTSAIGPGLLKTPTMNAVIFSGAESLFLQAEAVQNGYIPGTAKDLYNAGITASFIALGLAADDASTYYSQNIANVNWDSSSDKEQAIITQKWISLIGYGMFEAWNEYRRTGIPAHPSSADPAAISQTFPTRIFYPQSELTSNPTNLAKEGTINVFTSKIFWAK